MSPRSREVEKGHRPTIPDQLSRLSKSDNIKDIGTWGSCEDSWPTPSPLEKLGVFIFETEEQFAKRESHWPSIDRPF